jgi:hypothetical protein
VDALVELRKFFQSESADRFTPLDRHQHAVRRDLAGFEHVLKGEPVFLLFPPYFVSRFCKKLDKRILLRALKDQGYLVPDSRGGAVKQVRLPSDPEKKKPGFYVIRKTILES